MRPHRRASNRRLRQKRRLRSAPDEALGLAGEEARARGILAELGLLARERYVSPGQLGKAIESAERGVPSGELDPALVELAGELGVGLRVCEMSMRLLGLQREELIDYPGLSCCGVATFLETATRSRLSMFI